MINTKNSVKQKDSNDSLLRAIFTITPRNRDLHPTKEFWASDTYSAREAKIIASNGSVPHANMKYIREISFSIKKETMLEDLKSLAISIREECVIDCFQISINRQKNIAHMLFDWYDYNAQQCFYLYETYQMTLCALIIRRLHIPFPTKLNTRWLRYFLSSEYRDNEEIYRQLLEDLKHKKLGKRYYRLLRQMIEYIEDVCKSSRR